MRAVTIFSRMPHGRRPVASLNLVQVIAAATDASAAVIGRLGAHTRLKTYCTSAAAEAVVTEESEGEEASTFDIGDGVIVVFDKCPSVVRCSKLDRSGITAGTLIDRTSDRQPNETSHQGMTLTTGSRLHRPVTTGLHPVSRSLTMSASSLPSKPFSSIAKPTVRLRTDFKMKLAKQKMEDEDRRRRQTATMSSSVQSTSGQLVFSPVTLSSSLNDSSRSSVGQNNSNFQFVPRSSSNSDAYDSADHTVTYTAHTAPSRCYIMPANSPGPSGFSMPIGVQDGRRSVTSQLSGCDEVASNATSFSEVDDLLSGDILSNPFNVEPCDSKDADMEVLSEIFPQTTLNSASYIDSSQFDSSQIDVKPPLHHCASYPSMAVRPPGYRGGRLKEPPPKNMKDMTVEELAMYKKERQKKDTHNEIEKRRRQKINECIQMLGTMLPPTYDIDFQNKKGAILEGTVKYLKQLLDQESEMKRLMEVEEQLTMQNRQLMLSIQSYQVMLQNKQAASVNAQPTLNDQPHEHVLVEAMRNHPSHVFDLEPRPVEIVTDVPEMDLPPVLFGTGNGMETEALHNMCDQDLADLGHFIGEDPMFTYDSQMTGDGLMFETIADDFLHSFN